MHSVFYVFIGGGVGSVLRWLCGLWALETYGPHFPFGTLIVNIVGCFVMGVFFRVLPLDEIGVPTERLLLMTGMLGGFTTFSSFALDSAALWMRDETAMAVIYVGLTFTASLIGVALGLFVGKLIAA